MTVMSVMERRRDGLFYWGVLAHWLCLMYSWLLVCPWLGGGPIEDEGLGLPHHLTRSQYDKQELAKRKEECILNKNKYKKMTVTIKRTLKMLHPD